MAPSLKLLHALRNAVARCEESCRAGDGMTEQELLGFTKRLQELTDSVRNAEHFTDLERALSAEMSFLQDKQEEALRARIENRSQKRIQAYSAAYMREFLTGEAERQKLSQRDAGKAAPLTEEQKRILSQLHDSPKADSVAVWDAAARTIPEPVTRLERAMAELEILYPPAAHAFAARLANLHGQSPGQRRDMLRDSLFIELAEAIKEQKELARAIAGLEDIVSQRTLDSALAEDAAQAVKARDILKIRHAHERIAASIKKTEEEEFAALRRKAVLEGLAELGYGKGLDMTTAVEENGRLVLREDAQSAYGIEITGAASPRMQVRVVAFSEKRDPEADAAAETAWCARVADLQEKTRRSGTAISIELARKAGEVPVKRVPRENSGQRGQQRKNSNRM
jgi:hypothetical protein